MEKKVVNGVKAEKGVGNGGAGGGGGGGGRGPKLETSKPKIQEFTRPETKKR